MDEDYRKLFFFRILSENILNPFEFQVKTILDHEKFHRNSSLVGVNPSRLVGEVSVG